MNILVRLQLMIGYQMTAGFHFSNPNNNFFANLALYNHEK